MFLAGLNTFVFILFLCGIWWVALYRHMKKVRASFNLFTTSLVVFFVVAILSRMWNYVMMINMPRDLFFNEFVYTWDVYFLIPMKVAPFSHGMAGMTYLFRWIDRYLEVTAFISVSDKRVKFRKARATIAYFIVIAITIVFTLLSILFS